MSKTRLICHLSGSSDTGQKREHNEDAIVFDAAQGYAILADGMGGYNAGEVASNIATTQLSTQLNLLLKTPPSSIAQAQEALTHLILDANQTILDAAQQPGQQGMGTTLVVALLLRHKLIVAHLGDSRLYRWRGGQLTQLTRDDSFLQDQIDGGMISPEAARHSPHKNLVTQALGISVEPRLNLACHDAIADDVYLLCSDGLTDMIDDVAITTILRDQPYTLAADALINAANQAGGNDNVSVILLQTEAIPLTWWERFSALWRQEESA